MLYCAVRGHILKSFMYCKNTTVKHAGPEAKGSHSTAGLTLLWASNPFRGNFNTGKKPDRLPRVTKPLRPDWQKESWQIFEETSGYVRPERLSKWPDSMTDT